MQRFMLCYDVKGYDRMCSLVNGIPPPYRDLELVALYQYMSTVAISVVTHDSWVAVCSFISNTLCSY
jgi:hypothetical protein